MHSSGRTHGFTLLELLIVCLLISISLTLAIPTLRSSLVTDELGSGSRKLISLIKSCRTQAVTKHQPFLIHYDTEEGKVWYQPATTEEETAITPSSVTLSAGIRIQAIKQANSKNDIGKNGIWVSKQGYMDKTAIQLIDKEHRSLSLLISPFLPTIKVVEGTIEF